jgi:hypothetical protein
MRAWRDYLQPGSGARRSCAAAIARSPAMLLGDQLDFAWVCTATPIRHRVRWSCSRCRYGGKPLPLGHLIVPATDASTNGFAALAGWRSAYSDPDSNLVCGSAITRVLRIGVNPAPFPQDVFPTHIARVVQAVADGVARRRRRRRRVGDAGATHARARNARALRVSDEYGFPPINARLARSATCARFATRCSPCRRLLGPRVAPRAQFGGFCRMM